MIAGPVIALFFLGIVVIWIYSSTLACSYCFRRSILLEEE